MAILNKENFVYCLTTLTRFFKNSFNDKDLLAINMFIKNFDASYCAMNPSYQKTAEHRFNSDILTRWLFLELKTIDEIVKSDPYDVLYLGYFTNGVGKPISFMELENNSNLLCLVLLIRLGQFMKDRNNNTYKSFFWDFRLEDFYNEKIKNNGN